MHISKIGKSLKILGHDKVKYFVVIMLSKYFKYTTEGFYSKLCEEQNITSVFDLLLYLSNNT